MRKWAKFVTTKPWVVILTVTILTVFFAYEMKNLRFENRFTEWMPKSDPVLKLLLDTGKKFGTNELIMVAIKAKNGETFSPEILNRVRSLTEELKEKEEVFLVTSITNAPDIRKIEGGIEVRDLLDEIPQDEGELRKLKEYVLSKETFVNNVISADGKWLAMAVYLRTEENSDPIKAFAEVVKPTVEKYLGDTAEVYYSGDPSDAYFANEYSTGDLKKLIPIAVFLILLTLYFSFKSWKGVLYPSLVVILATIWTFGTMGLFKRPMNIITPVLPVLLIALGSAYGIHVLNKIFHEDSEEKATYEVFVPVLMAAITTMVGFISFLTAKLSIIEELGLFSAAGIFYAMVISLSLIPAMCVLSKKKTKVSDERYGYSTILRPLARAVLSSPWKVSLSFFLVFLFFVLWIPRISREVNFSEYYPENSIPKKALRVVKEHFGGSYPLTLYIKARRIKSAEVLKVIRMSEDYLYSIKEASLPFSLADFIQEMNYQLNGRYHIPETDGEVSNLWFFMEGRAELNQILTSDNRESLIFAKFPEAKTSMMKDIKEKLQAYLDRFSQGFESYRISQYSPQEQRMIREKEAELVEEEMRWLGEKYGVDIKKGALKDSWKKLPAMQEPEVLSMLRQDLRKQILSEDFDFEISEAQGKRILEGILSSIKEGKASKEEFLKTLKANIPPQDWDEETGEDVASSFLYRLKEARGKIFVQRTWKELGVKDCDANFAKKAKGLLWELADGLAVLPANALPFRGKKVNIERLDQSGFPAAMARLDHFLYVSQLQSLALALILTFILMVALRRSLEIGAISTTPIIFTLGVIYGFLGLSGIPLDYATMMIAGISIGVGIDYAIHFIHGVFIEMEEGYDLRKAIELTYVEKGRAILSNSIAVILGFAVLMFSALKPLHHLGGTMMGSMFLAALAALTFLPALLLLLLYKNRR